MSARYKLRLLGDPGCWTSEVRTADVCLDDVRLDENRPERVRAPVSLVAAVRKEMGLSRCR